MEVNSRSYNKFSFDDREFMARKTSFTDRLSDEILYYKALPKELSFHFPRILDSGYNDKEGHFLQMELYKYKNLGHFLLNEQYSEKFWKNIFASIFSILNLMKTHKERSYLNSDKAARSMYIEKTEREFKAFKNSGFEEIGNSENLKLNDVSLKSFNEIWPIVKDYLTLKCLNVDFNIIHGDCCFSNILCGVIDNGKPTIKFIDPRGSFGEKGIYGDRHYDYAKIAHSVEGGYEYFINDKFSLEQEENTQNYSLIYRGENNNRRIREIFYEQCKNVKADITFIKVIQATIFIGMCARHYGEPLRQKAMFLTGLKLLNECYEQIIKSSKQKHNSVILMAGESSRFKDSEYGDYKPLIKIKEKTILDWTLDSYKFENHENSYFAIRKDHDDVYQVYDYLKKFEKSKVLFLKNCTRGNLETAHVTYKKMNIDENSPIVFLDSDNKFDSNNFIEFVKSKHGNFGAVCYFKPIDSSNKWCFAYNEGDRVLKISEKDPLGALNGGKPLVGVFYFSSGKLFDEIATKILANDETVKEEFYMSQTITELINNEIPVYCHEVLNVDPLGTPEDVKIFEEK